jgi:RimJ/RimL family protein N-acetyltransferase
VDAPEPLRSRRLVLRRWTDPDRAPFAALNSDPRTWRYLPGPLTVEQSNDLVDRIEVEFGARGFGLWALERVDSGEFIGFTGLHLAEFAAPFTPAVEVGWRLAPAHWDRGFATEAAAAALADGFGRCGLDEVVSFTTRSNVRSQRVMQRLGMSCDPAEEFQHPGLPADHPLRPHVLYRLRAERWLVSGD